MKLTVYIALFVSLITISSSALFQIRNEIISRLQEIIGTPNETVEVVKGILGTHKIELGGLNFSINATNSEVVDYLLTNVPFRSSDKRKTALKRIIYKQWHMNSYKPGTAGHKILLVCLKHVKFLRDASFTANQFLQLFYSLIREGDIELVSAFINAGISIEFIDFFSIQYLRTNQVQMVKYLVQQGLPSRNTCLFVRSLFKLPDFTPEDFESLIKLGIPLDLKFTECNFIEMELQDFIVDGLPLKTGFDCFDQNWMEIAMVAGRLDLARSAYKLGLRISTKKSGTKDITSYFAKRPLELARLIVAPRFDSKLLQVMAGIDDDQCRIGHFPKDVIVGEIGRKLYELEVDKVMSDMFEPSSSCESEPSL